MKRSDAVFTKAKYDYLGNGPPKDVMETRMESCRLKDKRENEDGMTRDSGRKQYSCWR